MKTNEIKSIVKGLKVESLTCKAVRVYFAGWVERYGKDDARKIEKYACDVIKAAAAARKAQADDARAYLSDGAKVAEAAWSTLLKDKEYKAGASFARYLAGHGYPTPADIIKAFSPYITKDGEPCTRSIMLDSEGVASYVYKARNIATVGGYLAALKVAISFARRQAIQGAAKVKQMEVVSE